MDAARPTGTGEWGITDRGRGVVKPLIEHIVTEDALLALEPEWRNLEYRMVKLPFVRFAWVLPGWRQLSTQAKTVRD